MRSELLPSLPAAGRSWRTRGIRRAAITIGLAGAIVTPAVAALPAHADPGIALVQQVTVHGTGTSEALTLPGPAATGDRIVVGVGIWAGSHPTTKTVTDSAGNLYTEVSKVVGSDGTEQTVWTATVTGGGGSRPTVTVTGSASADLGIAVAEYAGLSTAGGTAAVSVVKNAIGTAASATTVYSGATAAAPSAGLAIGFYTDSGFGTTPVASSGFTARASITGASDMDLLLADQTVAAGSTPNAGATTKAGTVWLMSTLVFASGTTSAPTAPGAPTNVAASAGDGQALVTWTAPFDGGSTLTSYTVTPYLGANPQPATTVTGNPAPATATVPGLTNGTTYTFRVTASNAIGTSAASSPSTAITPSPQGQWGPLQSWPLVAIQSVALNNGKYLLIDGWETPQPTKVWDPQTNTFTSQVAPGAIFCSGISHLPDGRIISAGGYGALGIKTTAIFDPVTQSWSKAADMNAARWYPSLLQLSDGRYVAISGNSTDANTWSDTPEVYDPATDKWTLLTGVNTSAIHEEEYPFSYLMTNGKVFTMGPSEDKHFVLDVDAKTWAPVGASGVVNGSSVMYRPGKILYSGGADSVIDTTPARADTAVIDTTAASPTWRTTAPMSSARVYHTLTMLADGKVLAVGGGTTSDQMVVTSGVLNTEIWDPATETWTTGPSMAAARNYHSTALLMPDGRVLVSGGGHMVMANPQGQFNAQIFSPGYLSAGPRPTISSADASASYGGQISVTTPDAASISAVNLVSLGADTHQADMGQHFVPLSFTTSGGALSVAAPASSAIAPAGDYMMFIVNAQGVPSVASMVHVNAPGATVPGVPSGVNAAAANHQVTVSWAAPSNGGSPVTSYTVTPYAGRTPLAPVTVSGSVGNPPATATTVTGLTNGQAYTFTVSATNGVGAGPASAPSAAVTPSSVPTVALVQQSTSHGPGATRSVAMPAATTVGNRMVVELGVWGPTSPKAKSVTDNAGNTYTDVVHFTGSDGTEQSVWTAPVTTSAGASTVTATSTGAGDIGVLSMEYSGLSTAPGAAAVDASKSATGNTSGTTVYSGATAPTSAAGLAMGFYTDSGFGSSPGVTPGWTARSSVTLTDDIDLFAEDQQVAAAATPNAGVYPHAEAVWLMSTVVFKTAASSPSPTAPAAPTGVSASAGNGRATVGWVAPANGGSPITSYTVTPYTGSTAQAPVTVSGSPPSTTATVTGLTNGTAYTFTVAATNSVGSGPSSAASSPVTPSAPTPPEPPSGVTASPGNGQAAVSWTAPASGGSPVTSYTVTPYAGSAAQASVTVSGSPPATTATVTGLTNGTAYTFTVAATSSVGSGPSSSPSNPVTPAVPSSTTPTFVQSVTAHGVGATRAAVLPSGVSTGDRIVVEVGVWGTSAPKATAVTDSAGNVYTEVLKVNASEGTEQSVWTALVVGGGGTRPTITAKASGSADIGVAAVEYSGLSSASGMAAVDVSRSATGTAAGATTVSSGATAATTSAGVALGFYADSGFGVTPAASAGFTPRAAIGGANDMDLLVSDQATTTGATPNAGATTKAGTVWLMSTVVFKAS